MNASQRRQFRRATMTALSAAGIVPGHMVERKAPGKAVPTIAEVVEVREDSARRVGKDVHAVAGRIPGNGRPVLVVKRKDSRVVLWRLSELVQRLDFRNISKGHALRLSA